MKKRLVIDWIRNIGKCDECGTETEVGAGFWITNSVKYEWCYKCNMNTPHTIVAHEVRLLEAIKNID